MVTKHRQLKIAALYLAATLAVIPALFPYLYMVLQSLAPWNEVERVIWPSKFTLRSYVWLLTGGDTALARPWLRALFNSFLVSAADTLAVLVFGAMTGYALARVRFKGARWIQSFLLFHMFYPSIILIIPTFLIVRFLGLYDTYLAMILPKAVSVWVIFMYATFFQSVPQDLLDAARVDGAGEWTVLTRILLPMSSTLTTVLGLVVFMERWTELLWDLVAVKSHHLMTLNVLLTTMKGPYGTYPGPLCAASVLLTLPIVIVFLIFSRRFFSGFQYIFR
ncbi:MAG: carbohydrate ABC transporter permease [Firmicutes bacterium]|nr:carbohydrate ABC transporter permease [Bacillota bacterium]